MAIISGLFVGVKNPASMTQEEIYQEVLRTIQGRARHGTVSVSNLFHGTTTMIKGGFGWCPPDLFRMPVGDGHSELHVQDNGDLLGRWQMRCLLRHARCVRVPEGTHPLIRSKLYVAMSEPRRHVLLLEGLAQLERALVVRVRTTRAEIAAGTYAKDEALQCEYVGIVHYEPSAITEPEYHLSVFCRIADPKDLPDLPPTNMACVVGTFKGAGGGPKGTGPLGCVCWQANIYRFTPGV